LIEKRADLRSLTISTGDCSNKELYVSLLLKKITNLRKLNIKGASFTLDEWIQTLDSIKSSKSLEKVILSGTFPRDFDVAEIEKSIHHIKMKYVRIIAFRAGKMPYIYEMNKE
jgi:hypothetical protein